MWLVIDKGTVIENQQDGTVKVICKIPLVDANNIAQAHNEEIRSLAKSLRYMTENVNSVASLLEQENAKALIIKADRWGK